VLIGLVLGFSGLVILKLKLDKPRAATPAAERALIVPPVVTAPSSKAIATATASDAAASASASASAAPSASAPAAPVRPWRPRVDPRLGL